MLERTDGTLLHIKWGLGYSRYTLVYMTQVRVLSPSRLFSPFSGICRNGGVRFLHMAHADMTMVTI